MKRSLIVALLTCAFLCKIQAGGIDVTALKISSDGKTDATFTLQGALDAGQTDLYFPAGVYLLGGVKIPGESRLSFSPKAIIRANPSLIVYSEDVERDGKKRKQVVRKPIFTVTGDNVRIEGLRFDFANGGSDKEPIPADTLIYADGVSGLSVSGFVVKNSTPDKKERTRRLQLLKVENSRDIILADSLADQIGDMISANRCANVTVHGNRMIGGLTLTTFSNGGENLRHHDNWSRGVTYQCVWRGGSPDPSRKAPLVPLGTAKVANRGVRPGDAGWIDHTPGVFDVMIQNNYGEYGTTLCWGNKGRQTIIDGNIARFMTDYSYGSEGGENLIFSNNISINSAVAGFMVMYWSEKVLITGNMVIVRHEPFEANLVKHQESFYFGQFIRLHHGPSNPEDQYGAGSVQISDNLFVNELADRLSGISIEAGRDVMVSNNKIINGLVRKSDEIALVKETEANKDMDEFQAQKTVVKEDGTKYKLLRRVGSDKSRVTIAGNELILRQSGDKPAILINGSASHAFIKANIIRKEASSIKFTDTQREAEKSPPRYMMYSEDDFSHRDLTASKPGTAIGIDAVTSLTAIVQDNIIEGWKNSITAKNTNAEGRTIYLITGNTTDGAITTDGPADRTAIKVEANIDLSSLVRSSK